MLVPACEELERRPSQTPLPAVALAEPPLFKWAKLRSGEECKSCLVWVCELQRDSNGIHRVKNNSFQTLISLIHVSQILFRNINPV